MKPPATVSDAVAAAADPWAWARETEVEEAVPLEGQSVTAVLITHNGAEWLPRALAALAAVAEPPDRVVLVDAGSEDESGDLLAAAADAAEDWQVVRAAAGHFGHAVAAGLAGLDETGPDESGLDESGADDAGSATEWIWLLHDDAEPAPDSLTRLLTAAVSEGAAIATPKLSQPATRQDPARVSELGASVSRSGRREVHVEIGEVDQGQHDRIRQVLGGSTCGLLVRRDAYERLGGLESPLTAHRDGVELGWRATLAGESVIAVPDARVFHRQAGLAGLRPGSGTGQAAILDRAYGLALVTAHSNGLGRVLTPIRLVLTCLLRALGFLLGKAPDRAGEEMAAVGHYLAGHRRTGRLRAAVRRLAPTGSDVDRAQRLRPGPFSGLRRLVTGFGAWWADWQTESAAAADGHVDEAGGLDELTGDDFAGHGDRPAVWRSAPAVTAAVAVVLAVIASRGLFGTASLSGPALLPAAGTLTAAWTQWLSVPDGAGWLQGPPWLGIHAALGTVAIGRPEWASTLLVVAIVPVAFLMSWLPSRRLFRDRRVRVWASASYALLPVLLGASTQGRLTLSVVAVVLPLAITAMCSAVAGAAPGSQGGWRAAAGAGLASTALIAFQPLFGLLIVLAAGLAIGLLPFGKGTHSRRHRPARGAHAGRLAARAGVMLAVPALALAPWWPTLIREPAWWLLGPDSALDRTQTAPEVWHLLLGRPGGEGLPPLWLGAAVFGICWLLAVTALVLRPQAVPVRIAWGTGVVALAVAMALTRLVVPAGAAQIPVVPWTGAVLLLAFAALIVAGAFGIDPIADHLQGRDFGWHQPLVAGGAAVLAAAVLLGAGWWAVAGGSGPLDRRPDTLIPAFVATEIAQQPGDRVLAVDAAGPQLRYVVTTGAGIGLGDADRGYGFGADLDAHQQAADVTRRLLAATGDDTVATQLGDLGVRYVAVRGTPELLIRLTGTAGLRVVSVAEDSRVWQVTDDPGAVPPVAAPVTRTAIGIAIGQGIWLIVVGFWVAPRLRPSRSKDPAQRARQAGGARAADPEVTR